MGWQSLPAEEHLYMFTEQLSISLPFPGSPSSAVLELYLTAHVYSFLYPASSCTVNLTHACSSACPQTLTHLLMTGIIAIIHLHDLYWLTYAGQLEVELMQRLTR